MNRSDCSSDYSRHRERPKTFSRVFWEVLASTTGLEPSRKAPTRLHPRITITLDLPLPEVLTNRSFVNLASVSSTRRAESTTRILKIVSAQSIRTPEIDLLLASRNDEEKEDPRLDMMRQAREHDARLSPSAEVRSAPLF